MTDIILAVFLSSLFFTTVGFLIGLWLSNQSEPIEEYLLSDKELDELLDEKIKKRVKSK